MDDPETWTTLGTRHRMKTNKTKHSTQKTKKIANTDPIKKLSVNPGAHEGKSLLLIENFIFNQINGP